MRIYYITCDAKHLPENLLVIIVELIIMDSKAIFEQALNLKPVERVQLIEWLAHSLNEPDEDIDAIWAEEAEKRYEALKQGKVKTIPLEEIMKRYR